MGRHELAVVMATVCRQSLLRAVRSVFQQKFAGRIQILIGVDCDPDSRLAGLRATLASECPANMSLVWLDLGYSTSARHGGVHACIFGGSLRSALTLLADAEIVLYLDDDDWFKDNHCSAITQAIQGNNWAYSFCIYSDGNTSQGLCLDELESVGLSKGVFAERFGGFVRPSALAINKLALMPIIHLWSCAAFTNGEGEDRLIFNQLCRQSHGCTGQATVFYALDPRDVMHRQRVAFMRTKGVNLTWDEKQGSVR